MRKRKDCKTAPGATFDVDFEFHPPNWRAAPQAAPAADQPGIPDTATGRIPRITRLMALAIKFQDMVDRGEVRDYADLARLGYVSRARITQIMNLLNLAPDIQELLLAPPTTSGDLTETRLRPMTMEPDWRAQRRLFHGRFASC
jgi:hypothetical protein